MSILLKLLFTHKPPKSLKILRFFVHWLTLPVKLLVIGISMIFAIIYHNIYTKNRKPKTETNKRTRQLYVKTIFNKLPILRHRGLLFYVCRVPLEEKPNGMNHNDDHQAARHGTWTFLMKKLGFESSEMDKAVAVHCQPRIGVVRGFKGNKETGEIEYNSQSVSGDQLLGIALATSIRPSDTLRDAYEEAILKIIENDYSILEGYEKEPMDKLSKIEWKRQLTEKGSKYAIYMKCNRAMYNPGLLTVGAQALTILAAIKVGAVASNSRILYKEYNKLLWVYGYGILSLFPISFIPGSKNRGYFNDHNIMIALYLLASNANSNWGKWYWTTIMKMVYLLSNKWKNGYFAGLLHEVAPNFVKKEHLSQLEEYLYEEEPRFDNIEYTITPKVEHPDLYPVEYNKMNRGGEFHPDLDQKIISGGAGVRVKNGLGWFAHATMLNPEFVKKTLKEIQS